MEAIDGNTGFLAHRIAPREQGHRLNFTISIPYGCGRVTGIVAVATLSAGVRAILASMPVPPGNAGRLSLRHRAPGDILFQSTVPSGIHRDENHLLAGVTPPDALNSPGTLASSGLPHLTGIILEADQKCIAAYYVDEANLLAGKAEEYTVDIIIRYQRLP